MENLYKSLKILRESGIVLEKKLRSEMTPEELADARAKSKKRREARKIAAAEKRGYEKAMRDHMTADYESEPESKMPAKPIYLKIFKKSGNIGGGWWVEKPGKPEYQAFKDLETLKKAFGSSTESLINGARLDYEDGEAGGPGWKVRVCDPPEIPDEILERLNKDLGNGISHSCHGHGW